MGNVVLVELPAEATWTQRVLVRFEHIRSWQGGVSPEQSSVGSVRN